jgi:hypothetical protein
LVLAPLAAVRLPAAASPLPSPTGTPAATTTPISVGLTSITPTAPQPGDTVVVTGAVRNTTSDPISDLGVELLMGGAVIARSTLDSYAADPTGSLSGQGLAELAAPQTPLADPTLEAGKGEPFSISVAVDTLGLPTNVWQVRELGVQVNGATPLGVGPVGQLRTFLPWAPRSARFGLNRLQLAWLWPIVDRPHRGASPVWYDDDLAAELAPSGRLGRLVAAAADAETQGSEARAARRAAIQQLNSGPGRHHHHKTLAPVTTRDVPVTWAIDPMVVGDAGLMRLPYQVAGSPKPTAGTGGTAARGFLTALRNSVGTQDVIPLPYGDPDVVAAVRAGLGTLVGVAATSSRTALASVLSTANLLTQTAWPAGGLIDERGVNALFSDFITRLVLSDTALPPREPQTATPTSRTSLTTTGGNIPVVLTDSTLSAAVDSGAGADGEPSVDLQRFLAETLMIEAEAPTQHRSVVVAPGRRWSPGANYADALLADTGKVPWLAPVSLHQILDSPADAAVTRDPLTYPSSGRHSELPSSYLDQVATMSHSISELANILPPGDTATRPYNAALLRSLSTAWRGDPVQRSDDLDATRATLAGAMSSVRIASAPHSFITLTSHGGKLPVTIANDLNAPVNVTVELEGNQRLTFSHGGRVNVSIPAHQHLAVSLNATAKTSGVFPIQVQLLTPSGKKYGGAVQLFVRSTVYGTITLVITGAATAALLIAVAIRLIRRVRASRRPVAAAP